MQDITCPKPSEFSVNTVDSTKLPASLSVDSSKCNAPSSVPIKKVKIASSHTDSCTRSRIIKKPTKYFD